MKPAKAVIDIIREINFLITIYFVVVGMFTGIHKVTNDQKHQASFCSKPKEGRSF